MAFYDDLGTTTQITTGPHVRAIGWLEDGYDFPKGEAPKPFRDKLAKFAAAANASLEALHWSRSFGPHQCDFCSKFSAAGNFGVPADALLYVCPEMVSHYVQVHQYLPPQEFIDAVLAAPLPGTPEYLEAVRRFLPVSARPPPEPRNH